MNFVSHLDYLDARRVAIEKIGQRIEEIYDKSVFYTLKELRTEGYLMFEITIPEQVHQQRSHTTGINVKANKLIADMKSDGELYIYELLPSELECV